MASARNFTHRSGQPETRAASTVRRAATDATTTVVPPASEQLLTLQRSIGNQAIARILIQERGATEAVRQVEATQSNYAMTTGDELVAHDKRDPLERRDGTVQVPVKEQVGSCREVVSDSGGTLLSPGQPLNRDVRHSMEARFGQPFDGVRVHIDAAAARLAAAARARAYTVGQDIFFGYGKYAPWTQAGQRLLAHELAHVLQQRTGEGPPPGTTQEREAATAADQVGAGMRVSVRSISAPGMPQLAGEPAEESRLIFLDTNVVVEIADRGNTWIEEKIQELRRQGHKIYLPQQVYNELLLQPLDPRTVAADRAAIQRLGLEVGPSGTMSSRVPVYIASGEDPTGKLRETVVNRYEKRLVPILSEPDIMLERPVGKRNDVLVAAQVKAAGGELLTFDPDYLTTKQGPIGKIRTGPRPEVTKEIGEGGLGLKIAPESWEWLTPRPPGGGTSTPGAGIPGPVPPSPGTPSVAEGVPTASVSAPELKGATEEPAPTRVGIRSLAIGETSPAAEPHPIEVLPRSPKTTGEPAPVRAMARGEAESEIEPPSPKGMGLEGAPSPVLGAVISVGAEIAGSLLTSWMHDKMLQAVLEMPSPAIDRVDLWAPDGVRNRTSLDLLATDLPTAVTDFEIGRVRQTFEVLAFWRQYDGATTAERRVLLGRLKDAVWNDQSRLLKAQHNVAEALQLEPQITEAVEAARDLQAIVDDPVTFGKLVTETSMRVEEVSAVSNNLAWYQASFTRGVLQPLHQLAVQLETAIDGNEILLNQIKLAEQGERR